MKNDLEAPQSFIHSCAICHVMEFIRKTPACLSHHRYPQSLWLPWPNTLPPLPTYSHHELSFPLTQPFHMLPPSERQTGCKLKAKPAARLGDLCSALLYNIYLTSRKLGKSMWGIYRKDHVRVVAPQRAAPSFEIAACRPFRNI